MKAYTKPAIEVKEFGLSAAIADLAGWLAEADNADLALVIDANAVTSYAFVS